MSFAGFRRGHVVAALVLAWMAAWPAPALAAADLDAEAARIARAQAQLFGKGYRCFIDPNRHIVYVSALDDAHLRQTVGLLTAFADAFRRTLPTTTPAWNVTVVLPTVADYRKLDLPAEDCVGFYHRGDRRLVSVDRGRTLIHEFTHALHHADSAAAGQEHPAWVCEGLATLFEACEISPTELRPLPEGRLAALQRALREGKAIGLQRLLKMDHRAFMAETKLTYPAARYLMYYLHDRGRLSDWYERYKEGFADDPEGVGAVEAAAGGRLFLVEPQWRKWVLSLKMPASEGRMQQGRLGLEVRKTTQGVEVVGMVSGSAAELAGRIHVGDVIEKLNGHEIGNVAELVGAVRNSGALQTVEVCLRRQGRPMTIVQPLGAPPKR